MSKEGNIVAIAAFIIAGISLILSIWWRYDENKKWEVINVARIDVTNMYFVGWKEIDPSTARSIKWGFTPMSFSHIENRVHRNKMRLLDKLVLWNTTLNSKIEEAGSFLIRQESVKKGSSPKCSVISS